MSTAVAGKYQDHYQVLGAEPRSDSETIHRAYARLAEKYHPDNNFETGDFDQFEAVSLAFEVLSDPVLRKEFDNAKGIGSDDDVPNFSGKAFFESFSRDAGLRIALLCILCDRRRTNPLKPGLLVRQVEKLLACTESEMEFVLWYLKLRGMLSVNDKSTLMITADGVDFIEKNRPSLGTVANFLKPGAAVVPETAICYSPDGGCSSDPLN